KGRFFKYLEGEERLERARAMMNVIQNGVVSTILKTFNEYTQSLFHVTKSHDAHKRVQSKKPDDIGVVTKKRRELNEFGNQRRGMIKRFFDNDYAPVLEYMEGVVAEYGAAYVPPQAGQPVDPVDQQMQELKDWVETFRKL